LPGVGRVVDIGQIVSGHLDALPLGGQGAGSEAKGSNQAEHTTGEVAGSADRFIQTASVGAPSHEGAVAGVGAAPFGGEQAAHEALHEIHRAREQQVVLISVEMGQMNFIENLP
jgi:hypothetical protein